MDSQGNHPCSARHLRWENNLWPFLVAFKPWQHQISRWTILNDNSSCYYAKHLNRTFVLTGNIQLLSFKQDPKPANLWQLITTFHGYNTGGLVPIAAWILGAYWTSFNNKKKSCGWKDVLNAINNYHWGLFVLTVSQQWVLQLLPCGEALPSWTLHHTPGVCVWVPALRLLERWLLKWGRGDLQRSLRGLWRFPQQNEGSLTSLLFNSLLINPVRQGVRMNNVTVGCTLTTIISLHTPWTHLQFITKSAAKIFP